MKRKVNTMSFIISIIFSIGFFCLLGSSYKFLTGEYGLAFYLITIALLDLTASIAFFKDYLKGD